MHSPSPSPSEKSSPRTAASRNGVTETAQVLRVPQTALDSSSGSGDGGGGKERINGNTPIRPGPFPARHTPTKVVKNATRAEYHVVSRSSPIGTRRRSQGEGGPSAGESVPKATEGTCGGDGGLCASRHSDPSHPTQEGSATSGSHSPLNTASNSPTIPSFDPAYALFVPAERSDTQTWASPTSPSSSTRGPHGAPRSLESQSNLARQPGVSQPLFNPMSATATPTKAAAAQARLTVARDGGLGEGQKDVVGPHSPPDASQTRLFGDVSHSSCVVGPTSSQHVAHAPVGVGREMETQVFLCHSPTQHPARHTDPLSLGSSGAAARGTRREAAVPPPERAGATNGILKFSAFAGCAAADEKSLLENEDDDFWLRDGSGRLDATAAATAAAAALDTIRGGGAISPVAPVTGAELSLDASLVEYPVGSAVAGDAGPWAGVRGTERAVPGHFWQSPPPAPPPGHGESSPHTPCTPKDRIIPITFAAALGATPGPGSRTFTPRTTISQPATPQKSLRRPNHHRAQATMTFASKAMNISLEAQSQHNLSIASAAPSPAVGSLTAAMARGGGRSTLSCDDVEGEREAVPAFDDYLEPNRNPYSPYRIGNNSGSAAAIMQTDVPAAHLLPHTAVVVYEQTVPPEDRPRFRAVETSLVDHAGAKVRNDTSFLSGERESSVTNPVEGWCAASQQQGRHAIPVDGPPPLPPMEHTTLSMAWPLFARRSSGANTDSGEMLPASAAADAVQRHRDALGASADSPSPIETSDGGVSGKRYGVSGSGTKSEPSDMYGVSMSPTTNNRTQTNSQSLERMYGSAGTSDDLRLHHRSSEEKSRALHEAHLRCHENSPADDTPSPRKRLFSLNSTPHDGEADPGPASPPASPSSLSSASCAATPERRLFGQREEDEESADSCGGTGEGAAPDTHPLAHTVELPLSLATGSSATSPDRFFSTQRGVGVGEGVVGAFSASSSTSARHFATGRNTLPGQRPPPTTREERLPCFEAGFAEPIMEAPSCDDRQSTELPTNPHATPGSDSAATRAPQHRHTVRMEHGDNAEATRTTRTTSSNSFTVDTSSSATQEGGRQPAAGSTDDTRSPQRHPSHISALLGFSALPPRVTITAAASQAPPEEATTAAEEEFIARLSTVHDRLSRSSSSSKQTGWGTGSSSVSGGAKVVVLSHPFSRLPLRQARSAGTRSPPLRCLSRSTRTDCELPQRLLCRADSGGSMDYLGSSEANDGARRVDEDEEGNHNRTSSNSYRHTSYCDGMAGEDEEENEPGDRFRQHHTFQFAHPMPLSPAVAKEVVFIPLSADVNGWVWLATHRLDGLPYAVKEVPLTRTAQKRQLAVELECLTLGNDAVTQQQRQAEAFLARYYTCKTFLAAVMMRSSPFPAPPGRDALATAMDPNASLCEGNSPQGLGPCGRHTGRQQQLSLSLPSPQSTSLDDSAAPSAAAATAATGPVVVALLQTEYFAEGSLWEVVLGGGLGENSSARRRRRAICWETVLVHSLLGLEALHGNGLVHGCPLPFNIFACNNARQFKLGNFGSAAKHATQYPRSVPPEFLPSDPSAVTPYECDVHVLCSGLLHLFAALLFGATEEETCLLLLRRPSCAELAEFAFRHEEELLGVLGCSASALRVLQGTRRHPLTASQALDLLDVVSLEELAACRDCDEEIAQLEKELLSARHQSSNFAVMEGQRTSSAPSPPLPGAATRVSTRLYDRSLPPLAPAGSDTRDASRRRHSLGSHSVSWGRTLPAITISPTAEPSPEGSGANVSLEPRPLSPNTGRATCISPQAGVAAQRAVSLAFLSTHSSAEQQQQLLSAHAARVASFYEASLSSMPLLSTTAARPLTSWEHL